MANTDRFDPAHVDRLSLGALVVIVATNFAIAGAVLMQLALTDIERTLLMIAGMALGFSISGRPSAVVLHVISRWEPSRCMVFGTWAAYTLGAGLAVGVGTLLAK
jgi:hypothetical protein